MCFSSCERDQVDDSEYEDEGAYCQDRVGPDFICRSSGGGAANRKICVPGDCGLGASCANDDDCSGDLECLRDLPGGYCGRPSCEGPQDCPGDAACVEQGGLSFCARPCASASDCSFCRYDDDYECSDDVSYVGEGSGARCVPR